MTTRRNVSDERMAEIKESARAVHELDPVDRQILDFLHLHFNYRGARDEAIRQQFDMTSVRFDQRVNRLIDDPAALAYAPTTINRLRRLREQKQRRRARIDPYPG